MTVMRPQPQFARSSANPAEEYAMLPYGDVIWVGDELQRRFGLPIWQFA
jgi:hypothetical protein